MLLLAVACTCAAAGAFRPPSLPAPQVARRECILCIARVSRRVAACGRAAALRPRACLLSAASRSGAGLQPHGSRASSAGDAKRGAALRPRACLLRRASRLRWSANTRPPTSLVTSHQAIRSQCGPNSCPRQTDGRERPEHHPRRVQDPGAAGSASERSRSPIPSSASGDVHPYGPTVALGGCNQHPKCPSYRSTGRPSSLGLSNLF